MPIDLTEGDDEWKTPGLSEAQAAVIQDFGHVVIERRSGKWMVKAKKGADGWAGRVRLGTGADAVEIQVTPKIHIQRLLFLASYTLSPVEDLIWRDEEIEAAAEGEVVPAVAHAFARAATRALARGLPHGYRETEETSMVVRGRIRASDQVRRHGLRPFPVEIRYDEYVPDIPANQLLRAAAEHLLTLPGLAIEDRFPYARSQYPANRFLETVAMLRRLLRRLSQVSSFVPGRRPPKPDAIPRDTGWRAALSLADLVLRDQSYELRKGSSAVADGLFLWMSQIFEDFVAVALKRQLEEDGGGLCTPQDGRHGMMEDWEGPGKRFSLAPDLVYERPGVDGQAAPFAIIDAKYKTSGTALREDIHEMLVYCTVFGARHGYLVSPGDPAGNRPHRVTNSTITITEYFLDLNTSPGEVRRQIRDLAADILQRA